MRFDILYLMVTNINGNPEETLEYILVSINIQFEVQQSINPGMEYSMIISIFG